MAGLLDFLQTPGGIGLLSAVAGGMAGARRGTPINNLGRGAISGLTGYQTAQDQIQQDADKKIANQYRQMQIDQMQRSADQTKQTDAWRAGLPGAIAPKLTGTTQQGQMLADQNAAFGQDGIQPLSDAAQYAGQNAPLNVNYGVDKQAVQQYMMQPGSPVADKLIENQFLKQPKWTVSERFNEQTGMREKVMYDANNPTDVRPFGGTQAVKNEFVNGQAVNPYTIEQKGAPIPKQANMGSDLLVPDGKGGYKINSPLVAAKQAIARSGASNISIGKQETEEAKTVGKGFGEDYMSIQKAGQSANGKIARYQRLSQLLDGVNTGKLTPMGTEIASAAQSLGLNIDPNLGNKQAAAAMSNEMALTLRNPSGGAGMPGALSDKDREFLTGMVPGIDKTPEGRKMMTDSAIALAKRDIEVSNLARNYRMKHGSIDDGFYTELQNYADAHPLFNGKAAPPKPAAKLPNGWTVQEH